MGIRWGWERIMGLAKIPAGIPLEVLEMSLTEG